MNTINEEKDGLIRIVVLDISNTLGSNVYDEAIVPVNQATNFAKQYIDMSKYRIVTV